MTEYWQSQAKKFCDFCKCWITDNKPSIEFHENGKKHKDNVERRIKEVRKRGIQVRKDDDELKKSLKAIEAAAIEAYKKDIGEDVVTSSTTNVLHYRPLDSWKQSIPSTQEATVEMCDSSRKGCSISYVDGQPVVSCIHHWSIGQSEQGYYYYFNTHNNATQWEVPPCLQSDESEEGTPAEESLPSKNVLENSQSVCESTDGSEKDMLDCSNVEKVQKSKFKNQVSAPASSPYGAWTTVRTIEVPIITKETQARIQSDTPEVNRAMEDPEVTAKNTEKKFKERKTPNLSGHKTDEVVQFKKRKSNSEGKRNIRQTNLDS